MATGETMEFDESGHGWRKGVWLNADAMPLGGENSRRRAFDAETTC